jgi:[ribosomal protein S18]-alanine N-acetyltransferase
MGRWAIYNGRVKFKLRDFRREDFNTLWKLDQECFPQGIAYTKFELTAYIKRSGSFAVVAEAEPGPDVLGFIVAEANRRGVGHIITIDVRAGARRSGIASALLRTAEDRLRSAKCRMVRLESAVDNTSALAFYKRHQYDVVKTLPRYYSTGVDAFGLEKDLLSPAPEVNLLK